MLDLHLRADTEADLAAALPMFRGTDRDGKAVWITSGPFHALDVGFPIETAPAVLNPDGSVKTPAVLDPRIHANLRLLDRHPHRFGLAEALALHCIEPKTPRRVFA